MLFAKVPWLAMLIDTGPTALTSWSFYEVPLVASLVLFVGGMLVGLLVVVTVPRLLNLALAPGQGLPAVRDPYSFHRVITRMTNRKFFHELFGDSSYIVHYLQCLGYRLSPGGADRVELRHRGQARQPVPERGRQRNGVCQRAIDRQRQLHEHVVPRVPDVHRGAQLPRQRHRLPAAGQDGRELPARDEGPGADHGEVREGVGLLGSPSFEIPRTVQRDSRFVHLAHGADFPRRLAAKNRHNLVTHRRCSCCRAGSTSSCSCSSAWPRRTSTTRSAHRASRRPASSPCCSPSSTSRWSNAPRPGSAACGRKYCSIYELDFWRTERFFKLCAPANVHRLFNGTPFKSLALAAARASGSAGGSSTTAAGMSEKNIVTIGDDVTLNAGAYIQCHSQEDYAFKSDAHRHRLGLHRRDRRHDPLRGDHGRRCRPRPRLLPHEGRGGPAARAVGRQPGREMPAFDPFALPARSTHRHRHAGSAGRPRLPPEEAHGDQH